MRLANLAKVEEIDAHIQQLLNELSELYRRRGALFNDKASARFTAKASTPAQPAKRTSSTKLDNIDFSTFDLTLRD